jgi:hypothetical protein
MLGICGDEEEQPANRSATGKEKFVNHLPETLSRGIKAWHIHSKIMARPRKSMSIWWKPTIRVNSVKQERQHSLFFAANPPNEKTIHKP